MVAIKRKIDVLIYSILLVFAVVLYFNALIYKQFTLLSPLNFYQFLFFCFIQSTPYLFILLSQIALTNVYHTEASKAFHGTAFVEHGLKIYAEDQLRSFYLIDPVLLLKYAKRSLDKENFQLLKPRIDQLKRWNKAQKLDMLSNVVIFTLSSIPGLFDSAMPVYFIGLGYILLGMIRFVLFYLDTKQFIKAISKLEE
jgi:hypothetical protein